MKLTSSIVVCSAVLTTAFFAGDTQAEENKFYVKGALGAAKSSDVELRDFFGQAIAANSEIDLEPGVRGTIRGGYGLTDWLDAEAETGFIYNDIDAVTGATRAEGSIANFPLLLNLRLHLPESERFSPYIGAGFGICNTVLSTDNINIGGTAFDGFAADTVFAYQAFAGVRFAINERMGLSLEYHYFHADKSNMEADVTVGVPSDTVKLGRTESHSISVAFDFHF